MTINGLSAGLNMPAGVVDDGEETVHGLPPYAIQPVYRVDDYIACPESWVRSTNAMASYFVAVENGMGAWFDFNMNNRHSHHIAVVIYIQGINPLTGQRADPNALRLEQYSKNCPVHDIPFEADRYCKECSYNWPPQNYLASAATEFGNLWLDGFLGQDGIIRQFLFTAEKMRGIAEQLIGEDRVWAVGIAFFEMKEPKPKPKAEHVRRRSGSTLIKSSMPHTGPKLDGGMIRFTGLGRDRSIKRIAAGPGKESLGLLSADDTKFAAVDTSSGAADDSPARRADREAVSEFLLEKLEIAAGAQIRQRVHRDPSSLEAYKAEPSGMIVLNYVPKAQAEALIAQGRREEPLRRSFLSGVKVGNEK